MPWVVCTRWSSGGLGVHQIFAHHPVFHTCTKHASYDPIMKRIYQLCLFSNCSVLCAFMWPEHCGGNTPISFTPKSEHSGCGLKSDKKYCKMWLENESHAIICACDRGAADGLPHTMPEIEDIADYLLRISNTLRLWIVDGCKTRSTRWCLFVIAKSDWYLNWWWCWQKLVIGFHPIFFIVWCPLEWRVDQMN